VSLGRSLPAIYNYVRGLVTELKKSQKRAMKELRRDPGRLHKEAVAGIDARILKDLVVRRRRKKAHETIDNKTSSTIASFTDSQEVIRVERGERSTGEMRCDCLLAE